LDIKVVNCITGPVITITVQKGGYPMILKVFKSVGDSLSIANAYTLLMSLYSKEVYPAQKAAGSLGGAVNGGTIVLIRGDYVRVR